MASTEYGKHMGELKRGEQRWDVYLENQPDTAVGAVRGRIHFVNVRFTDLPGTWQHFSIPLKELEEDTFTDGLGFDGSSIRGFQAINESDMLLLPDPASAFVDPCLGVPTLSLTCDIVDPITRVRHTRDRRYDVAT